MAPPTPDPTGRPSTANHAVGSGEPVDPGKGSTGSHRSAAPAPEPSLSNLIRAGSSSARRSPAAEDVAAHLAAGPPDNTDDAPTVITRNGVPVPAVTPPPPYVVGEGPSVAGRRLGHFELIEAVGAGGMAAVLKARDLELGRVVALKILPPESAQDPENVTRFKQEARAAARLDHENVARVYFCGEDQGLHFIAFEFVEGITLRQMIDRRGTVPPGECVRYMIQVAAGLSHASERGVVHRDIKPSNILITPDGRAKIVDMGLARHLESQPINGGVTQSGVTLGTFDYISPEQALDPRRADVRSDIYSLGCAFYHALTGRPPVPEGTAARKLDAQQNVEPLDPRELNPAIPDELAAVLARMMAKDPDRRYQTPGELIAHLKGVAERLRLPLDPASTSSDVRAIPADPYVLPAPPRVRLGWAAAVVAVAIAVVAVVISASGPGRTSNSPPWPEQALGKKDDPPLKKDDPARRPGKAAEDAPVRTAEELARALAEPGTTEVRLVPGGDYDLTKLDRPVVFEGPRLKLTGSAGAPPRVRFASPPRSPATRPGSGMLVVKAGEVKVTGVRFEIAPPTEEDEAAGSEPTGLAFLDAKDVTLLDCLFFPDEWVRLNGLASASVVPVGARPVHVRVERCLFAPGGVGLRIPTLVDLTVEDSGFGPHTAAIQVRDGDPLFELDPETPDNLPDATRVHLHRSSFMLDAYSAVVSAEEPFLVRVTAGYCVFAPAGPAEPVVPGMASPARVGVVVRLAAERPGEKVFAGVPGRGNAYYRVDPVGTTTATASRTYTFEECQDLLPVPAEDAGRVKLDQRPWDAPAGGVLAAFADRDPHQTFRLRLTDPKLAALPDRTVAVIGAQFQDPDDLRIHRAYPRVGWPPPMPTAADIKVKVWYPNAPADAQLEPGTDRDLVTLLRAAKSGDTIQVRGDGVIPMDAVEIKPPSAKSGLDRGDFELTFEPYPGTRPVLTPADSSDLDVSLFRVKEGRVNFNGLEFQVRTDQRNVHNKLAAVTLVAARGCTFKDCTFTLSEDDETKAAAVIVSDPSGVMKMEPAGAGMAPQVRFDQCLIRGRGRGVWVPVSRPVAIDMKNSVTAIDGPVILAEPAGREPNGLHTQVTLTRVTALLGGPLVALRAGKVGEMRAPGLAPLDVTANQCVFAAVPNAGKPLVELDGVDPDEIKNVLRWGTRADKPNWYANYDPTAPAAAFRLGDESAVKEWNWDRWVTFAGEPAGGKPVGKVTFADAPAGLRELAAVTPADAEVKAIDLADLPDAKVGDAGADVKDVAVVREESESSD